MKKLYSKEIEQYFTDCTYRCIPNELSGSNALLVLMGYNYKYDKFELVLIALLSHEDCDIFTGFNNFLKNI